METHWIGLNIIVDGHILFSSNYEPTDKLNLREFLLECFKSIKNLVLHGKYLNSRLEDVINNGDFKGWKIYK